MTEIIKPPVIDAPMSMYTWLTEWFPKVVLEEPRRLWMATEVLDPENHSASMIQYLSKKWERPSCNTTACVCGWLGVSTHLQPVEDPFLNIWGAMKFMEFTALEVDGLFYYRWKDPDQGTQEFAEDVVRNTRAWAERYKERLVGLMLNPPPPPPIEAIVLSDTPS